MQTIRLINLDTQAIECVLADGEQFSRKYNAIIGSNQELVTQVVKQTAAMMRSPETTPQWFGYLVVDGTSNEVVGISGFTGPPNAENTVEIAYFTFPNYVGKGYATAMATKLIRIATTSPEALRIIAHTLPERNASTRVLEKVGMTFLDEVIDPKDGKVWRWVMAG